MRYTGMIVFVFAVCIKTVGQNIGIGTTTPGGKLQINHRATASSPTLRLFDSTAGTGSSILFTKESQSNSFSIVSTIGILAASNTLDFRNTFSSGILLKGDGKVGINNVTNPIAALHVGGGVKITDSLNVSKGVKLNDTLNVSGDINMGGGLKVNGDAGLPGQALMKSNTGQLTWQFPEEFRNVQSFTTTTPSAWEVPAGVNRIKVELWGGGGGGGAVESGNSGAFVMTLLNVTPGDIWNIQVGTGGSGNDPNGNPGDTTSFTRGGIAVNACGGRTSGAVFNADFLVTGITSYIGLKGQTGRAGKYSYEQINNSFFIFVQDADGADAPLIPHTGGGSGWGRTNGDGSAPTGAQGKTGAAPGGGGGLRYGNGGNGMLIISW